MNLKEYIKETIKSTLAVDSKSVTEARSINKTSAKFLKGMKKLPIKSFADKWMPGNTHIWYDTKSKKFYFVDYGGDHMELKNTATLNELLKFLKTMNLTIDEAINEAKSMDMNKRLKVYDKLKKGDEITIKYGSSMSSGNETTFKVTKGKTLVGKQKVERIILQNVANPKGVKYYLYQRNGNVSLAIGNMAASIEDMSESVNEVAEPQIKKIAELTGVSVDKVEKYVSSRVLNITKLLKYIKDERQVAIRDFEKAVKGDKKQDAYFIKMFNESVNEEQLDEKKNLKSKDSTGIRKAEAIYNNIRAIEELVIDKKRDPNEVIPVLGTVLVNAIKATLKHNFKPIDGNEDKLKEFYSELKTFLKIVEALVKKPSKVGVKRIIDAHRQWWNRKHGSTIVLNGELRDTIIESVNEEQLDEKLITFSNRAPYGQIVFMAGGAGSGKGFAIDNFIDSAGFKVRDVDEMKKAVGELDKLGKFSVDKWYKKYGKTLSDKPGKDGGLSPKAHIEEFMLGTGLSISDISDPNHKLGGLKNSDNVASLHYIVDAMGLKDKWVINMLSGKTNKETLPNLLFDITAKKVSSITSVIKPLIDAGYDSKNVHLIWVLKNFHAAVKANAGRDRVVPDDILLQTHEGASQTMWQVLTKITPRGLGGRIDVILNNNKFTAKFVDSKGKEIQVEPNQMNKLKKAQPVVSGFKSLPIKKQGGGFIPEKYWQGELKGWILSNTPPTIDFEELENPQKTVK